VQVNSASIYELMESLGIDARRARLITQFRTSYGRFKDPEDLAQVSGITDDMIRRWEKQNLLIFD
jgi:competence ComEA-like helix-hairpin-helix protein